MTTIVIIVGCLLVFFLTESGWGEAAPIDVAPTPAPVLPMAEDGFMRAAFGDSAYTQTAPQTYLLPREDANADATLRLSTRDAAVCGFLLLAEAPQLPAQLDSPLEMRLYAKRRKQYEADVQWMTDRFAALARALDTQKRLTDADMDSLQQFIRTAAETQARQDQCAQGYLLRAYVDKSVTPAMLHVSLQDEAWMAEKQTESE